MTPPDLPGAADDRLTAIRQALQGLAESCSADGYSMNVESVEAGRLRIVVEAGAEACAECLIPRELFEGMISNSLPPGSDISHIDLIYPQE